MGGKEDLGGATDQNILYEKLIYAYIKSIFACISLHI